MSEQELRNVAKIRHQSPKEVIMVRPAAFGFDEDTMASNAFQKADVAKTLTVHQIQVQNKRYIYIYIYKFKTN